MIVTIEREAAHVAAMGHRVALELGGEAELKRRCLETLSRLDFPPDQVRFDRLWESLPAVEPEPPAPLNSSTPTIPASPSAQRSHKRR